MKQIPANLQLPGAGVTSGDVGEGFWRSGGSLSLLGECLLFRLGLVGVFLLSVEERATEMGLAYHMHGGDWLLSGFVQRVTRAARNRQLRHRGAVLWPQTARSLWEGGSEAW